MKHKALKNLAIIAGGAFAPILALAQDTLDDEAMAQFMRDSALMGDPFAAQTYAGTIGFVVIIVAAMLFAYAREKRRQELLARFLEKEQEIPATLLPAPPSRQREIRRGIWLSSLGLGLGLVLYIASGEWVTAAWSLILIFLAAASFINAAFFYENGR